MAAAAELFGCCIKESTVCFVRLRSKVRAWCLVEVKR